MEKEELSQSPLPTEKSKKIKISLSFIDALQGAMVGKKIRRMEWEDVDEYGLIKDSFLMIHRKGKFFTWIVSEGDIFATDWSIL